MNQVIALLMITRLNLRLFSFLFRKCVENSEKFCERQTIFVGNIEDYPTCVNNKCNGSLYNPYNNLASAFLETENKFKENE